MMAKKPLFISLCFTFIFASFLWGCTPISPPAQSAVPPVTIEPTDLPILDSSPIPSATLISRPMPTPIEIMDGLNRIVTLDLPAQRIVSMAPSNTEILFAIGAGDQVVGRDEFSDFPAETSSIPSVGGGFGDYNNEAIINLQPDLVIAAEINTAEQVKVLDDLGITVFYLSNSNSIDEMYANLLTIARLTGHAAETSSLIESLKARVSAIEEKLGEVPDRPKVFYELDATDPNAPYTAGAGTFIDTLITKAGGENIASDLGSEYPSISAEELLLRNPEIILLGDAAYGITPDLVSARPGWEAIDAVMKQRIYAFDDNLVSRPGPRLVDGLEALAILLHPELFQ